MLRVIQHKAFERVGGTNTIQVDVRIVAATNKNLESAVHEGSFRSDLYYRLNVLPVEVPPLRERKDDIPVLAKHFLKVFNHETKKQIIGFSSAAMETLLNYSWPGNVRELENTVERAVVLCKETEIRNEDLLLATNSNKREYEADTLKDATNLFKKHFIESTLQSCDWNQTRAAEKLDIQRTYLSRLIKELEIQNRRNKMSTQTPTAQSPQFPNQETNGAQRIIQLIVRLRIPLIGIAAAVFVAVIIGFITQHISSNNEAEAAVLASDMQQSYYRWLQSYNDDEKANYLEQFTQYFEKATNEFSGSYTGRLAIFLQGNIAYEQGDFPKAAESFEQLLNNNTGDHFASLAGINAALAYEEEGNTEKAIQTYEKITQEFDISCPEVPRALFSLGRLNESIDTEQAMQWYQQITNGYPESDWTNLAEKSYAVLTVLH
jgi:tetratricopeptide (TPR) repeat protein